MGSIRRHIQIRRPADDIWALVGDPTTIHTWFPGIVDCTVDGTTRVITTGAGLPMPEEIVLIDPIQRRFQYRLTTPMVRNHLGTIDVIALEQDHSLVAYSTDCDPEAMALIIGGATGGALAELRRQFEVDQAPAGAPDRDPGGR
jgi:hypothetical protein